MEKSQLQSWPIVLLWIITEGNNPSQGFVFILLKSLRKKDNQ